MQTVRDLFAKALAMKVAGSSGSEVRLFLLNTGHEIGHRIITEVPWGDGYQLTFSTDEKIRFDGTDYHYER